MISLETGLSALTAAQRALEVIGQNLANANTPGYHRQVTQFSARPPTSKNNLAIGTGVEVSHIHRVISNSLEGAITRQTFEIAGTTSQLEVVRQLESSFGLGNGQFEDRLEQFFNQIQQLASQPESNTLRRIVIGSARALTGEFNLLGDTVVQTRQNLDGQLANLVAEVNGKARDIAALNRQIRIASVRGIEANDLLDQRDQLINELAQSVGVRVIDQDFGQRALFVAGVPVVLADNPIPLHFSVDSSNQAHVTSSGSTTPIPIQGGKIGGLLEARNLALPDLETQLDALAREFARQVNSVQATGLGLATGFDFLSSQHSVESLSVPLAQAELSFPIQAGSLFVSVEDLATGERILSEVIIDPTTDSLQDVASALNTLSHLQALTNSQNGTLQILAAPGYRFDFAGRLQQTPDPAGITGTTRPTVNGLYTDSKNDLYTFQIVGSGTVGSTPNLLLQVTDASGSPVGTVNIGQGYEPGTLVTVGKGVKVQLSSGSANDGDTFSVRTVGEPDETGILSSLGFNPLFRGSTARELQVHTDIEKNPALLAASRSGEVGDNSNLRRLLSLRDKPVLENGTKTFSESYRGIVTKLASDIQELDTLQASQQAFAQVLEAEQQGLSGVDPNEELVRLLQFQRSFQVAAEYLSVVNETLDELFRIL